MAGSRPARCDVRRAALAHRALEAHDTDVMRRLLRRDSLPEATRVALAAHAPDVANPPRPTAQVTRVQPRDRRELRRLPVPSMPDGAWPPLQASTRDLERVRGEPR